LKEGVLHEDERFSVEQIVAVLKEAEAGMPVGELIHRIVFPRKRLPLEEAVC
jgi:hypothetical protein